MKADDFTLSATRNQVSSDFCNLFVKEIINTRLPRMSAIWCWSVSEIYPVSVIGTLRKVTTLLTMAAPGIQGSLELANLLGMLVRLLP